MATEETRSSTRSLEPNPEWDEPLNMQRFSMAVRRQWRLAACIVLLVTLLTIVLSLLRDDRYRATAHLLLAQTGEGQQDAESVKRQLATLASLIETPRVLVGPARQSQITITELKKRISTSVDANANIISIAGVDARSEGAAALANSVATAFVASNRALERSQLREARAETIRELRRISGASRRASEVAVLQTRVDELSVQIASAGNDLRIAERAQLPRDPYAPQPLRNAVIAFVATALIALVVILAREQMNPHVGGARELSRLTSLPVLGRVPWRSSQTGRSGDFSDAEIDAYLTLEASLNPDAFSASQFVVLVTSAIQREGKSRVSAGLAMAMAQSGHTILLIDADMRSSAPRQPLGVTPNGFAELLQIASRSAEGLASKVAESVITAGPQLSILGRGSKRGDAVKLLSGEALSSLFASLTQLPYDCIIIDAPPLLAIPDSRLLARAADWIIFVGRPGRVTVDNVLDSAEALQTLNVPVLGVVAVGAGQTYDSPD
jgi:receptor protein-tyrosine kinase